MFVGKNYTVNQFNTEHNSTFAIGGVSCSKDHLVVAENFVLRINISGKNLAHRKSAKRYSQPKNLKFKSLN
ncbi:MAG: hypothetical protein FGM41_09930 [Bacteroidetes bacterium]|nr:hypothetical protein [Bacteroidota bacterium]